MARAAEGFRRPPHCIACRPQRLLTFESAALDELLRDARRELSRDGAFRPDDSVLEGLVQPRLQELLPTHEPEEWELLALCKLPGCGSTGWRRRWWQSRGDADADVRSCSIQRWLSC